MKNSKTFYIIAGVIAVTVCFVLSAIVAFNTKSYYKCSNCCEQNK